MIDKLEAYAINKIEILEKENRQLYSKYEDLLKFLGEGFISPKVSFDPATKQLKIDHIEKIVHNLDNGKDIASIRTVELLPGILKNLLDTKGR